MTKVAHYDGPHFFAAKQLAPGYAVGGPAFHTGGGKDVCLQHSGAQPQKIVDMESQTNLRSLQNALADQSLQDYHKSCYPVTVANGLSLAAGWHTPAVAADPPQSDDRCGRHLSGVLIDIALQA